MQEKVNKPVTNRQFAFFGGIAIALLAAICFLNMWILARAITYIFFFIFGVLAYFFFAYMFVQGTSLIIRRRAIKFKFSLRLVGIILVLVSSCLLFTSFYKPSYSISNFGDLFEESNYFLNNKPINFFSKETPVGGGFIGIVLYQALNSVAAPVPFIIGFLVLLVGFGFIFINPILAFIANQQAKTKGKKKAGKHRPKKEVVEQDDDTIIITRDLSSEVIKEAGIIDEPVVKDAPPELNPIRPMPLTQEDLSPDMTSDLSFGPSGTFKPAHFIPGVIPGDTPSVVRPTITPKEEPVIQPNPQPTVQPTIQQDSGVSEQLTLDFEEPKVDPSVVTAQPVFEEPVASRTSGEEIQPIVQPAPKKRIKWVPPSVELLEEYETTEASNINIEVAEQRSALINQIFKDYKVGAEVEGYTIGPSVTRYNITYQPNVQSRAVENIIKDIARRVGGVACRFEAIVEGSYYSGLEIPNARVTTVSYKDVFEALPDVKKTPTSIAFGKNIQGDVVAADFRKFPHILVAGTTGSGKSIFIHSIICTLIMRNSPDDLKLVLVDPKKVEMVKYREIPHLLCPIINDPHKAKPLLDKLVAEMNRRYELLAQGDGFSDISEYNEYAEEKGLEKVPVIVAILDEFGDLVETCKDISQPVVLIGQKARACGIHMLIATQSPTSDIITGSIKSNLPTHVALSTANTTQSVTILGEGGAEKLLGKGDMLVQSQLVSRVGLVRLQGCYIANKEISRICGYLREHYETQYDENFLNLEEEAVQSGQEFVASGGTVSMMDAQEEAKYQSIKEWVMAQQYTSMSRIQGECGVGFNRARRFFTRLVKEGVVAPESEGNKGCRVLIHDARTSIDTDDIPVSDELSD